VGIIERVPILPQEILGIIYAFAHDPTPREESASVAPNFFRPTSRHLLHFQRMNLYHTVELFNLASLGKICDTLRSNPTWGKMAKGLTIRGQSSDWNTRTDATEITNCLGSILRRLSQLTMLDIGHFWTDPVVVRCLNHLSPSARITQLSINTNNDVLRELHQLFPSLRRLTVLYQIHNLNDLAMPSLIDQPARCELEYLSVQTDSPSASRNIRNWLSTIDAKHLDLALPEIGLLSGYLRTSGSMERLALRSFDNVPIDPLRVDLTHIKELKLSGYLGDLFFTDWFTTELLLESLHITSTCQFSSEDLLDAWKNSPSGLRKLTLDSRGRAPHSFRRTIVQGVLGRHDGGGESEREREDNGLREVFGLYDIDAEVSGLAVESLRRGKPFQKAYDRAGSEGSGDGERDVDEYGGDDDSDSAPESPNMQFSTFIPWSSPVEIFPRR
jgi:hypothetical protein